MVVLAMQNLVIRDFRTKAVLVNGINFTLERNSCLAIVGESGSGKTVILKAILGLTNPSLEASGSVFFDGIDLLQAKGEMIRRIRGRRICMILQDPLTAFDPVYTIGNQMAETLCEHLQISKKEAMKRSLFELQRMNIGEPLDVLKKYPHQLSGGMLQRCMIAIVMAMKPEIIIADEPTTALDSINQNEVLAEFQKIRNEYRTSLIFVSHDLKIVQSLADYVLVLKDGKQVEYGRAEDIFSHPKHEYTKYLLNSRDKVTEAFIKAMSLGIRNND
ncbi:ABC transporter ATP-binding protein [Schinkia azotoformans]|uniref:ABC transporter ATP-binding protein n=1 Tax=Schinkia azotoformans TaxID=1454 RepID=UPI002DBB5858|nr:ABC transporter ATP-binding protein [Schinkia azotoformans]MEC1722764.1 ABC transporter ATP-binding protein [Schinkia azotoformans]MED4413084.1 ABC transporter ATP-binding protein [Schinkia azotoformans]